MNELVKIEIHDYNRDMRISNPAISQYLGNSVNPRSVKQSSINPSSVNQSSVNQSQTVDRFPVKAVSIEDQPTASGTTIPQIIAKPASENFADSLLIQSRLSDSLATSSQQGASSDKPSFPYANRRSFEGLAGSSLVIQKYLNNEPSTPKLSESIQRNINFFI